MAQLVERVLGKDEVTGSNPVISSIKSRRLPHGKRSEANVPVFLFYLKGFYSQKRANSAFYGACALPDGAKKDELSQKNS